MLITSGHLSLDLDAATGSIRSIADSSRGVVHTRTRDELGDARLFRIIAPLAGWSSHFLDSQASRPPVVEERPGSVTLRYESLTSERGEWPVQVAVELTTRPDADEILIGISVLNGSDLELTDVTLPWVSGWSGLTGAGSDMITLGASQQVDPHGFPRNVGTTFFRWHQRDFWWYPEAMFAPWVDISDGRAGLSYIVYTPSPRNVGFMAENLTKYGQEHRGLALSLGWCHFARIAPGSTWEAPPVGLSVHGSDWHATADRFNAWASTHLPKPSPPRWAREAIGFQNVMVRGFNGTPFREFSDLPAVAAAAARYGVPHLCVWDYALLGQYARTETFDPLDLDADTAAAIKAAVTSAREQAGVRVSALVNFRLLNPMSPHFGERQSFLNRKYDGNAWFEEYPDSHNHGAYFAYHRGPVVCPADPRVPEYRDWALDQVERYLDLGFSSIFWDQPYAYPSYNRIGDATPDSTHAGVLDLASEARQRLRQRHPDGILVGEFADSHAGDAVDLWMSWYTDGAALERVRYSLPDSLQSWVVDQDPSTASRAVASGTQLCLIINGCEGSLDDVPEFAQHVKTLGDYRRKWASHLVDGTFRHHEDIQVDVDGDGGAFSLHTSKGRAISCFAGSGGAQIRVTDGQPQAGGQAWIRTRLDGSEDEVRGAELEVTLKTNELAIFVPA